MPLEKRYVWQLVSALKWGLGDCDDLSVEADERTLTAKRERDPRLRMAYLSVEADERTLTEEDFARVMNLMKFRPMQLALVLKVLVGAEEMQRMMIEAIGIAKRQE